MVEFPSGSKRRKGDRMKQNLLKTTLIAGMMTCTMGFMSACTSLESDETLVLQTETEQKAGSKQAVCTAENSSNCVVTYEEPDLNLSQTYAGYAVSTNSSYQGGMPVAVSVPATKSGLSVKEKMAQQLYAQQQADLALQPVQGGEVVCTGDACSEALFKTEIEKTIKTTVTENQATQTAEYVYVAADGQMIAVPSPEAAPENVHLVSVNGKNVVSGVPAVDGKETVSVKEGQQPTQQETTATSEAKTAQSQQKVMSLKERIAFGEEVHDWDAPAGETLRHLLMRWGEMSGWTVIWKLDRDYNLEAGVVFRGKFTEVSAAFIRSFARATPAPIGTFYKGNRVLVINTQENENAD